MISNVFSGVITSPNFPHNYENNQRCVWRVVAPRKSKLQFTFTSFRLEARSGCRYDYVEIRRDFSDSAPFVGRYCGFVIPPTIIADGGHLQITLRSDSSNTERGFRANFIALPFPTTKPPSTAPLCMFSTLIIHNNVSFCFAP